MGNFIKLVRGLYSPGSGNLIDYPPSFFLGVSIPALVWRKLLLGDNMAKPKLKLSELVKLYPELSDFTLDGKTDFNKISDIIGSKNPKMIWPVIDTIAAGQKPKATAQQTKLAALLGL